MDTMRTSTFPRWQIWTVLVLFGLNTNVLGFSFRGGKESDRKELGAPETVVAKEPKKPPPEQALSIGSSLLPDEIEKSLSNIWEPYHPESHVPLFWQIPRVGSTHMLSYLTVCVDLVEASGRAAAEQSDKLELVKLDGHHFVNVDTTTKAGLEHARDLNLVDSNLAHLISSSYAYTATSTLFTTSKRQGKMFAMLRDPIDRLVSKFYYMKEANWERNFDPAFKDITLEQYAQMPKYVNNNWMTRQLVGKIGTTPLLPSDLQVAKDVLKRKCLIGLTEHFDESVDRFQKFFGWEVQDGYRDTTFTKGEDCKASFFNSGKQGTGKFNASSNSTKVDLEPGSVTWDYLQQAVVYDIEVYIFARELFQQQSELFRSSSN